MRISIDKITDGGNDLMPYDVLLSRIDDAIYRAAGRVIDVKIIQEFNYDNGDYRYRGLVIRDEG